VAGAERLGPLRYTMTAHDAIERELARAPAGVRERFRWLPFGAE
jgi:hypothetical protein